MARRWRGSVSVSGKGRGPYRKRAADAADRALATRVERMADLDSWNAFASEVLTGEVLEVLTGDVLVGGTASESQSHGNRRLEREAVLAYWLIVGTSIAKVIDEWEARTSEWAVERHTFRFAAPAPYVSGTTGRTARWAAASKPPKKRWAAGVGFSAGMVAELRSLAPASVRSEPRLLLAWVEWMAEMGDDANRQPESLERRVVERIAAKVRGTED